MATKKQQGILTANRDTLLADELENDPLKEQVDPYGQTAGKTVATYYDDIGAAMSPEQHSGVLKYKKQVSKAVSSLKGTLDQYKNDFATSMEAADKEAQGILSKARASRPAAVTQEKVPVTVVSNGNAEATYWVNKQFAETAMPELEAVDQFYTSQNPDGTNKSVDVRGYGKEVHELFIDAQNRTNNLDNDFNQANAANNSAYNMSVRGIEEQIASQSKIAHAKYDQDVTMAESGIEQTQRLWTKYRNSLRKNFIANVQRNETGITNLLSSGALVFKGESS